MISSKEFVEILKAIQKAIKDDMNFLLRLSKSLSPFFHFLILQLLFYMFFWEKQTIFPGNWKKCYNSNNITKA